MWSLCSLELEGVGCGHCVHWGWKRSGVGCGPCVHWGWKRSGLLCYVALEEEWGVVMSNGVERGVECVWGWKGSGCYWICLRMCGGPPAPVLLAVAELTMQ